MSKQMQISIKQIYDTCYPLDTPEKVLVFREYVKQNSILTSAILLDFQIYLEKTTGSKVRKYARLIEKLKSHSHSDITPDELKMILDIIHSADQTAKLERLCLFVSGAIIVMIFVILFLWFKGLI